MPTLIAITAALLLLAAIALLRKKQRLIFRKQKHSRKSCRGLPKPEWVKREVIRIKTHVPNAGCRHVADIFNRRFAAEKGVTVGKTKQ
ncbi:MAG: hypothetical protein FWH22_08460 [Fibromonadales bacterium]|nr:hypothetical protein [Fibromonadales bacterium]